MSQPVEGSADDWLARADEDLLVAVLLLSHGLFNSAAYHCQQCAEKAVKALLVEYGVRPSKTHDLDELVYACRKVGAEFGPDLIDAALVLTPFAMVSRYPGWGHVSASQAEHAVALSRQFRAEVARLLASRASGVQ